MSVLPESLIDPTSGHTWTLVSVGEVMPGDTIVSWRTVWQQLKSMSEAGVAFNLSHFDAVLVQSIQRSVAFPPSEIRWTIFEGIVAGIASRHRDSAAKIQCTGKVYKLTDF